ncbi:MAG TPA: gamma-glutamylcyclotransferase family protein [Polyangia bacterium]|nr:gamma-glutamylcyclotransferase family protein [Polyangia bacterium]
MTFIFVYGTLKRGCANHGFLAGQRFIGEARTTGGFTLFELSGYPGMVERDSHPAGVTGEVWSVDGDCLKRLDELEGTAEGLYRRDVVPLLAPFGEQRVEAYFFLQEVVGRVEIGGTWTE